MQAAVIDWKRGRLGRIQVKKNEIRSFDSGFVVWRSKWTTNTSYFFFGPSEKKLEINFERARDHFFDMPAKTAIFNNI